MVAQQERWRAVVGFEELYEVSDWGRVQRVGMARGVVPGRILIAHLNSVGYPRVPLCREGKAGRYLVHGLVAAAFLGPRPDNFDVNHKDGLRTNAAADNLEYISRSENILHAHDRGWKPSKGEGHPSTKLTAAAVREIRASTASARSLAMRFGVHPSTIGNVRNGRTWAYVEDNINA